MSAELLTPVEKIVLTAAGAPMSSDPDGIEREAAIRKLLSAYETLRARVAKLEGLAESLKAEAAAALDRETKAIVALDLMQRQNLAVLSEKERQLSAMALQLGRAEARVAELEGELAAALEHADGQTRMWIDQNTRAASAEGQVSTLRAAIDAAVEELSAIECRDQHRVNSALSLLRAAQKVAK